MLIHTQLLLHMEISAFPSGQLSEAQKPVPYLIQMKTLVDKFEPPGKSRLDLVQRFQYHLLSTGGLFS